MVCIPNILLNDTINGIIDNILRTVIELEYSGPNKMLIIGPANMNTPTENINPNIPKSCAIISIRMDFKEYYNADSDEKILLTKKMILRAVKKIKSKGKFDYDAFERDFDEISLI